MKKEVKGTASNDLGNVFIWSGFKYYLWEKAAEPVKNEASKDAGKEDKKAGTKEEKSEKKSDKSALKEDNQIPEDGVITKEQMESIAGEKGEYRFHGETSDGIKYTWIYDGSKIKNPIEQKLKVEFSEENLDEIKKAADDALKCISPP